MTTENETVYQILNRIQKELKVPKSRNVKNKGGKVMYTYRNADDILEEVKSKLGNAYLLLSDDVEEKGGSNYLVATATLGLNKECISVKGYAKEGPKSGVMSDAQNTGSTASFARKYALNGLFALDDTEDMELRDPEKVNTLVEEITDIAKQKCKNLDSNGKVRWMNDNLGVYSYNLLSGLKTTELEKILEDLKK